MNKFIADALQTRPYGFIPVKGVDAELVPAQPFHDPQGEVLTGRIECTLRALSPLLPGNTQKTDPNSQGKQRTYIYPLKVGEKPIVSRHTLKGCIGSFMAAFLGIPMTRVNDRRFTFRPNISPRQGGTIQWGYGIIESVTRNRDGRLLSVKVAQLTGDYGFCSAGKGTVSESTLTSPKPQCYTHDGIQFGMLKRLHPSDRKDKADLCFFPYQDGLDGRGTFAKTFPNQGRSAAQHNYFVIRAANHPKVSKVPPPVFTINTATIELYEKTLEALIADEALNEHPQSSAFISDTIKTNMKKAWPLKVNDIIFFEYKQGATEILTFGKHFRYRWAYRRTVGDSPDVGWVQNEFEKASGVSSIERPDLSLVRELFGYAVADDPKRPLYGEAYQRLKQDGLHKIWSAKSGKVRFNFAMYEKGGLARKYMILPRPGSPRSTAYEFYVQQDPSYSLPLNTYGDPVRADFVCQHKLSGRKMYYKDRLAREHHAMEKDNETDDYLVRAHDLLMPKKEKDSSISFPSFKFSVHFENLTKRELQLLLFTLTLGPTNHLVGDRENEKDFTRAMQEQQILCHQVGYGKNYGMGAVQISIDSLKYFQFDPASSSFEEKTPDHIGLIKSFADSNAAVARLKEMAPLLVLKADDRNYPEYSRKGDEASIPGWHTKLRNDDFEKRRA